MIYIVKFVFYKEMKNRSSSSAHIAFLAVEASSAENALHGFHEGYQKALNVEPLYKYTKRDIQNLKNFNDWTQGKYLL